MNRISSQYNNANTQYFLRQQEVKEARKNAQIGTQSRITALRDDPIAAGHLVRYQSFLSRVMYLKKMHRLSQTTIRYAKDTSIRTSR